MQALRRINPKKVSDPLFVHFNYISLHMNHKCLSQSNPSPELLAPPMFRLRGLVFDWLTLMATELELTDRSLYLAFDFFDVFLTAGNQANSRHQLHFFGLASLFIASKYEEIYPPSLKVGRPLCPSANFQEFISQASSILEEDPSNANLFLLSEEPRVALFSALLLKTEERLLQSLEFDTSRILAFDFLQLFASDSGLPPNPKVLDFAHFLLLVSQLNPGLCGVPRLLLGFSALYLSNRLLGDSARWPKVKLAKNPRKGTAPKFATLNIFSKLRELKEAEMRFGREDGQIGTLCSNWLTGSEAAGTPEPRLLRRQVHLGLLRRASKPEPRAGLPAGESQGGFAEDLQRWLH